MIEYVYSAEHIRPEGLQGFFDGWPNPPSQETHLKLLLQSDYVVLAIDTDASVGANIPRVVGFITAISDGVLSAYIPLLEVLPTYRGQGIGKRLTEFMLKQLNHFYMVDLSCDATLQPFYQEVGMHPTRGMSIRNFHRQSCQ